MNLGEERVENTHSVSGSDEPGGEAAADESGAPRDEDMSWHDSVLQDAAAPVHFALSAQRSG